MHAILRFEKRKSGAIGGIQAHHERKKDHYNSNPDIDRAKTGMNYHIKEPTDSYRKEIAGRIADAGCRVRKDSVLLVDCFVGGTHKFITALSREEQKRYFRHAYAFLRDKVGERNIVTAAVHIDEKTPHMHLCFVPITGDGRLSAKEILGHRNNMVQWQNDFYVHMHSLWPQLRRGRSAAETGRQHIPVQLYKQAEALNQQTELLRNTLGDIGRINAPQKRQEAQRALEKWYPLAVDFHTEVQRLEQGNKHLERLLQQEQAAKSEMAEKLREKTLETTALRARCNANQKLIDAIPEDMRKQLEADRKRAMRNQKKQR